MADHVPRSEGVPKDVAAFVAIGVTTFHNVVGSGVQQNNSLAHTFLRTKKSNRYGVDHLADLVERAPAKATHIALAVVLGAIESSTSKSTWRYPSPTDAVYFRQLAVWGYGLSEVEQLVIDAVDAKTRATPQATVA